MTKGTSRHDEIFYFIKGFCFVHNRMPTRKEVMYYCKIGRGPLQRLLYSLIDKGRLAKIKQGMSLKVVE